MDYFIFFLKVVMQSDCIYERKELVPRSCFVATCIINMDENQTVLTHERVPRIEVELILFLLLIPKVKRREISHFFQ